MQLATTRRRPGFPGVGSGCRVISPLLLHEDLLPADHVDAEHEQQVPELAAAANVVQDGGPSA